MARSSTAKTQSGRALFLNLDHRHGHGHMVKFQQYLIAALIGLQGALLVTGDVGCYLAWYCVNWLDWHGYLGMVLLLISMSMTSAIYIKEK